MSTRESLTKHSAGKELERGNVLGQRELNRALLARQYLLQRVDLPVSEVVEHLIGLQAQAPNPPYFGLWARINGFRQEALAEAIQSREIVRIALMRSTIHLVTARDCLELRPLLQPVLTRGLMGSHGKRLEGIDTSALAAVGRSLVEERPLTFSELGAQLLERWPDRDPAVLAAAVRNLVPLVQIPPRGLWGSSGQAAHTTAEAWLGTPLSPALDVEKLIKRYLAAFGPASVNDMQIWCGLTRLREIVDRLRPELRTFCDVHGNELFDLPDAPLPDGSTPAPPIFLGEFDNMLLSYADRTRIISDEYRPRVFTVNGIIRSTFLIDGFVRGLWRLERKRGGAVLILEPFGPLMNHDRNALEEEGLRLLDFAASNDKTREIRFVNK
ncbi:winged helix DNA-binding domain-containing protein [Paenibacillus sp. H1-7]|nr:winged helix DNA-binding domain-containing protein [Paenibacillus sp. H1-7]